MGPHLHYRAAVGAATLAIVLLLVAPTTAGRRELKHQASRSTSSLVTELTATMSSPLSPSQASAYVELFKRTGSVGDICQTGHLYCDADAYDSYYKGVLMGLDKNIEEKDIVVFFRESELMVGHLVTIADPRLQETVIERNRQLLMSSAYHVVSKYTYINVIKVPERAFLPVELAQILPFTSTSASQIFNLDESSILAMESSKTAQICKEAVHDDGSTELQGEAAACATSLEGMQSLLRSPMLLGPHEAADVEVLTTDFHDVGSVTGKVVEVKLKASESARHTVCHNLMYPSTVYFCHYLPRTRVYAVTILQQGAADGHIVDGQLLHAVAMCHLDTSGWNPRHLAFQNLLTLPGHGEACHWVLQGSLTYVPAALS